MAALMPQGKQQYFTAGGIPLVGGKVYTYAAGTTTPLATYTTAAASTPNANPVILDSRGEASIFFSAANYKIVVKDSLDSTIWTQDNLAGDAAASVLASLAASTGSSLVGHIASGTGAVATTVQSKLRESVSASGYITIQAAVNTGAHEIDLAGGAYTVTSAILFNQNNQKIKNGTLVFNGTTSARLAEITGDRVTFENVVFDGNSKQPRSALVYVDTSIDRPKFLNCTFKNLTCVNNGTAVLNQTYALLINPYAVTNVLVSNCLFKDLVKYNDGVNGTPIAAATVGLGFIGGICFLPEDMSEPTAAQPTPTSGIVEGCTFYNIQTILAASLSIGNQADYNDADAIRTYGYTGGAERLDVHIADCIFRNVSKRAFKFRAAGSVAYDCEVYADGMQYGMICPIDVTSNSKVQNIKVYASSSKPVQSGVQWSIGPDYNRETLVQGLFVSHCISGVGFFSDPTNQPLRNLVLRDIHINQATSYGIGQGSPLPSTMENIVIENVQIYGSGNNCRGIELAGAIDVTCGAKIKNVYIRNGSFAVGGVNNDIQDVQIEIDSSSYAGGAAAEVLFRIGVSGYGGYQHVENVFINAWNLNTAYVSATRTTLGNLLGDNANWKNIRIKVPDALSQTYPHCELWGNDWNLDGYTYDGPGFTFIATTVAGVRWAVKNAVRLGNGASSSAFLYTANANTGNGLFENITDFRPTTNNTITINNGLGAGSRFIVTNVASKSSNGTLVQNGGLATVTNAIYFP